MTYSKKESYFEMIKDYLTKNLTKTNVFRLQFRPNAITQFGNMLKTKTNFKIHQIIFKYWLTLRHFAMDDPVAHKENAQYNTYCIQSRDFFATFLPFFSYMLYVCILTVFFIELSFLVKKKSPDECTIKKHIEYVFRKNVFDATSPKTSLYNIDFVSFLKVS